MTVADWPVELVPRMRWSVEDWTMIDVKKSQTKNQESEHARPSFLSTMHDSLTILRFWTDLTCVLSAGTTSPLISNTSCQSNRSKAADIYHASLNHRPHLSPSMLFGGKRWLNELQCFRAIQVTAYNLNSRQLFSPPCLKSRKREHILSVCQSCFVELLSLISQNIFFFFAITKYFCGSFETKNKYKINEKNL